MTITVIKQISSAQLATELEEQPKFTAETLRDVALDMDAPDELAEWAHAVIMHIDETGRATIRALAAAMGVSA
jgi:hypothetical protein